MAAFVKARYSANNEEIHPIRLAPDVYAIAVSSEPTGGNTSKIHAKQSKTKREFGLRARYITIARTRGTGNDTFVEYANIPILTLAAFESATYAIDAVVNYKGVPWRVVSSTPESAR